MGLVSIPTDPAELSPASVCKALCVDGRVGLSSDEARERLVEFGPNELPSDPPTPFWKLVLQQFEDALVQILLFAASISFAMAAFEGDMSGYVEPFIIILILVLNATVGVWQENRAEGAIEALNEFVPTTAVVLREGALATVHAVDLVPGDVVEVVVGNRVPADIRLLELHSTTLRADECILSGESVSAMKEIEAPSGFHGRFSENMIYSGTSIVYGKARGVVVRTGASTEIGSIERNVREEKNVKTPLQVKLDEFGVLLSKVIGYICLAVFLINMVRWYQTFVPGENDGWFERYVQPTVHCLKVAVALAVAAIPEGLPAVVTTCLALGTRRMARHNAIVRDLPSIETLGRCTVICSDKTGTLTTNMMSVSEVVTVDPRGHLRCYTIEDSKFDVVTGSVRSDGEVIYDSVAKDASLELLATIGVLCCDASLHYGESHTDVVKVGEATEAALLVMSEKLASSRSTLSPSIDRFRAAKEALWQKNVTLEFTRSRRSMSVHCTSRTQNGVHVLFVKGAPEELLKRCSRIMLQSGSTVALDQKTMTVLLEKISDMSGSKNALRCLGFAFKPVEAAHLMNFSDPNDFESVEDDLTFVGVCGMLDPPREEIRGAIANCASAGIRVIVITGDKKETAEAVCRKLGILHGPSTACLSYTGQELDAMTMQQKQEAVMSAVVFSRTDPAHKLELVKLLQNQKLICAMTGDGVNDAPALKRADIGISMGSGTEVAKAASRMVLADDNFATVVEAVREGRSIFNNTKQFIRYLISSNIGEVTCVLITGILGFPEALSPVQLLWVNLVTDGLPATALGFNAPDPDIMEQSPRTVDEPIVNGWLFIRYMVVGVYVGVATVAGFLWWFISHGFTWSDLASFTSCTDMSNPKCAVLANPESARAIALSILVIVEMLNALNALSENQSLVVTRPGSNWWLLLAIGSSVFLHLMILYVPLFAKMFSVTPLGVDPAVVAVAKPWSVLIPTSFTEWKVVLVFSIPVIYLDELLKFITRRTVALDQGHAKRKAN